MKGVGKEGRMRACVVNAVGKFVQCRRFWSARREDEVWERTDVAVGFP